MSDLLKLKLHLYFPVSVFNHTSKSYSSDINNIYTKLSFKYSLVTSVVHHGCQFDSRDINSPAIPKTSLAKENSPVLMIKNCYKCTKSFPRLEMLIIVVTIARVRDTSVSKE